MSTTHVIFRPGKMASKHIDAYLKNFVGVADLDNGNMIRLTGLESGQADLWTAATPGDVTTYETFIVDTPVRNLIDGLYAIDVVDPREFYVPAGKIGRARKVVKGDTCYVGNSAITGSPTVGEYATPVNTSHVLAATPASASKVYFKIIATENFYVGTTTVTGYRLECVAEF
ncbi:hypothetical protein KY334_05440 [Candidatus Woesearchaeota archaeon]|nr:hypothetical protein [Candidatus Woesearchaeota archaeon]